MAKQSISTLKNWFRSLLKPTQQQFWDWMDSFWHKDENIPANKVENLQSLLDAKINVAERGAPNGLPVLDGQGKIITDYIPALAITDLHIALQPTLFDFCQYEWEHVSIQKGDLVQITRTDEVVEMYQLYTGNGSSPTHYKMINVSKIDWTNILNKPPLAAPSDFLALNQAVKQILLGSPIFNNLSGDNTSARVVAVHSDGSLRDLSSVFYDLINDALRAKKILYDDGSSAAPSIAFNSQTNLGFAKLGTNILGIIVNGLGILRLTTTQLRAGVSGTAADPVWTFNTDLDTGFFRPTSDSLAITTGGVERCRVTAAGNFGVNKINPTKKLHVNGTSGYEAVGNMGSSPEDFAHKQYVDSLIQAAVKLQGNWDADTNTPDITGVTTTGHAYRINVAGNTSLGGETNWLVNQLAVKTDTGWMKIGSGAMQINWGLILGDISTQSDLMALFALKADLAGLSGMLNNIPATNCVANGSFNGGVGGWDNILYSTLSSVSDVNYRSGYKLLIDNRTANIDQIRSNTFVATSTTLRLTYLYKRNADNAMTFVVKRESTQSQMYSAVMNATSLTFVEAEITGLSVGATYYVELYSNGNTLTEIGNIIVTDQLQRQSPKNSIQINSNQLQLDGDSATPGNSKYYGTNASGTKGFYSLPTGGSFLPYTQQNNFIKDGFFWNNGEGWILVGEGGLSSGSDVWSGKYYYVNSGSVSNTFTTPFNSPVSVKAYLFYYQSNAWASLTIKIKQGSIVLDTKTLTGSSVSTILTYEVNLIAQGNVTFEVSCNDPDSGIIIYGLVITQ